MDQNVIKVNARLFTPIKKQE